MEIKSAHNSISLYLACKCKSAPSSSPGLFNIISVLLFFNKKRENFCRTLRVRAPSGSTHRPLWFTWLIWNEFQKSSLLYVNASPQWNLSCRKICWCRIGRQCNLCCRILMNRAPSQKDNVITRHSSSAVRLPRFAEVIVSSPSLGSVCMAVTSASFNGEINYHWCHLSWHRSQFDHVNQMIGLLDIPLLCNHALMKRIKRRLGYLTEFIIQYCHSVMWTINWLTRSHSHSLTLIKVIELRCYMFRRLT